MLEASEGGRRGLGYRWGYWHSVARIEVVSIKKLWLICHIINVVRDGLVQ